MMKRSIVLLSMLFVVVLAAFPASAQDTAATPAPCSAADLKQTLDLMSGLSDKISTPVTMDSPQTADQLTTSLLAWNDAYVTVGNAYADLPYCVDSTQLKDAMAVGINEQMVVVAITLFNTEHSADKTLDMDVTPVLSNLWTLESDHVVSTMKGVAALVTQMKAGAATPVWFPACTEEQLKFTSQLDDLEQRYTDQVPALQDFLDKGTIDKSLYIAVANLTNDMVTALKTGPIGCADIYERAVSDFYVTGNTFLALTTAQIAPYLADSPSADPFNAMVGDFSGILNSYINVTTPTETPQ